MLTQGFRKFYGSITEAAEAPKTIFQKRGGACFDHRHQHCHKVAYGKAC